MAERDGDPAELQQEIAQLRSQVALLTDALENMSHGLCMFDAEGRIALYNRRYPDVIGLPPERVKPGLHARDLMALAIEAGFHPPGTTVDELENVFWHRSPGPEDHASRSSATTALFASSRVGCPMGKSSRRSKTSPN